MAKKKAKKKPAAVKRSRPVTPERIMQFAWAYAMPLVIESAVRHKVFDALDSGPMTLEQIGQKTGASTRGLGAIMNVLVSVQLLGKKKDRYSLTPESAAFLVQSKPSFQGGIFKHISSQLLPKWMMLSEIVRSGRPAREVNEQDGGAKFFAEFVEDIFPMSYGAARALGEALKLSRAKKPVKVLDLAAGSGVWGIALAQASPQVSVTAVDWEGVLPVTRRIAERHGVAGRFSFVAGDINTVDPGTGHNIATLGHILHSEGPDRSKSLLKRVFDALAPGGTIAIGEFLIDPDRTGPPVAAIFAVNMLVNTDAGDAFSFPEISGWLEAAGFVKPRTLASPGPSPLILATRP